MTTRRRRHAHVEPDGDRWTLVFVRELAHPPRAGLDRADRARRAARLGAVRARPQPRAPRRGDADDVSRTRPRSATIARRVTRADAPSLLEYRWGDDRAALGARADRGAGTRLTLSHTVAGEDWLPKVAAGWHLCLDVAERLLDGAPTPPIRGEEAMEHGWQELHDAYAERLSDRVERR